MRVPILDVAKYGVIKDNPDFKLPPGAWTDALNMRFKNDKAYRVDGQTSVMGTPSVAPGFVMSLESAGGLFWIYAQAAGADSKVYGFNSATHTDISQGAGYTIVNYRDWNGTVFQGTPILNYGGGTPQMWATINLATDLSDLSNWPASTTAKVIRSYKVYMIALNITDGDGAHPHRVLWSDAAEAGSVPGSWDATDPTVDANIYELSDVASGVIVDGQQLRDMFAIYKNDSTWMMRFSGGVDVMEFAPMLTTSGLLTQRCMVPLTLPVQGTQVHFLHNGIDVGTYDGGTDFETVLEDKDRRFINNDMDPVNYVNAFVFDNPVQKEAWFCYPQVGEIDPNIACVWDYQRGNVTFRDFVGVHAASGAVESAGFATWASSMDTWDTATGTWSGGARKKVVTADQANTLLLQLDTGSDFNGETFSTKLERTGLAIAGLDQNGNPAFDLELRKLIKRVWLKAKGGRIQVTVGKAEDFDSDPDYTVPADAPSNTAVFDPSSGQTYVDVINSGLLPALKFEGLDGDYWEISGYDIDVVPLGSH